ncbi:primary active transporter [Lithospermum erythrorhizon]|uniref:Primary active transporter n=1 Tax=Lithospermum erythrorhizon TaxID=34254 RepID=A0AAV3PD70_LITER
MPLFLSDEEFERTSHDANAVAEKADAFIRRLYTELDTVKAEADAASITAEQTCALLEQKFVALSNEHNVLQLKLTEFNASVDGTAKRIAEVEADKQRIQLNSIGKDGEIERLSMEASELHKSKRELMEMLERKDLELTEKNSTIKSYLDKIVNLTNTATQREARLSDLESELARCQALCARLSQEKELVERHNSWLNDELKTKVDSLLELRRKHSELEAEFSSNLADAERKFNETSSSLKWHKERVKELESNLESLQKEFLSSKDAAAVTEDQYSAELTTVTKLVDLYKESSEEWSKKAGELEGVIKALETHSNQVENDYKEKLETELTARKEYEKEANSLKEKLAACEVELERSRKESESKTFSLTFTTETNKQVGAGGVVDLAEDDGMLVPSYPTGLSGTTLAASLLRDGWSLAKMYAKFQEAIDAWRHEQLGRKETQAILKRVLYEIEEKSAVILDERDEHERLVEAYSALSLKLENSLSEQTSMDRTIQELKADLRKHQRDYAVLQKENIDLQRQVSVLLKECRDVQLRCGNHDYSAEEFPDAIISLDAISDAGSIFTTQRLTFKDINGLVEQNVQLRSLVNSLSDDIDSKQKELQENYEKELHRRTTEAADQVNSVLARAEEQGRMIESLHSSVAMYRKLYEEEHKRRTSPTQMHEVETDDGRKNIMLLLEDSNDASRKAQQQAADRLRLLEEEIAKLRTEIISVRSERDKFSLEAHFAQEKLDRFMKEFEHHRDEHNGVLARNVEFSQLIIGYQQKMRESSEALNAAEELSRKLTMEVSVLRNEKEMLLNAEKRASDEARSLSERVFRLQASLDTIHSTEEVREEARIMEKKKLEEYIQKIEREWAEAKKELQEEREIVRKLRIERENTMKDALKQVEESANASRIVAAAEARAAIAEARCAEMERQRFSDHQVAEKDGLTAPSSAIDKAAPDMNSVKEELERLREELQLTKHHMLQYKSIAEVNESAMKQIESVYENYKLDTDNIKKSLEDELKSLRERVKELETECCLKSNEVSSVNAEKHEALAAALSEVATLRDDESIKLTKITALEIQVSALSDDLEKEHKKWRTTQDNYERQVILQSETIQELTRASQALAALQEEASNLHKLVDTLKSENNDLRAKWEVEKSALEASKCEGDRRYNEINEQNKVLHSQLEALHIKFAEHDRRSVGLASGSTQTSAVDEDGMQNVVNYLRRSKEIAETEISLLKQEKFRLQSQLDRALKASESAQVALHAERSSARSLLFTEEDFKSLQLQVREINLLRESNAQLREENRHNYEECQKLREAAQKAKIDAENFEKLLRDKQNEVEACRKEIDMFKVEREHLRKKIDERNVIEKDAQLEETRKIVSEKKHMISQLEQDIGRSRTELTERESRINALLQVEASLRSEVEKQRTEIERQRRLTTFSKKKYDNLSKEKDDLSKEIQALTKQLEDAKQGKRTSVDAAGEQALKDARLQMLEKMMERTREDLKAEKAKQKTMTESYNNVAEQRSKLLDELEKHKQAVKSASDEIEKLKNDKVSQLQGASAVELPPGTLLEDLTGSYLGAVVNFERAAQPIREELGVHSVADSSAVDTSSSAVTTVSGQAVASSGPNVSGVGSGPSTLAIKTVEEKEKQASLARTNVEMRKTGRKLVRPRIVKPEEPQVDTEMSEVDGSNNSEKQTALSQEPQGNTIPLTARKRPSTSLTSESQEDSLAEETSPNIDAPLPKKAKGLEASQEDEGQVVPNQEANESTPVPEDDMVDAADHCLKEECVDPGKDDIVESAGDLPEELIEPVVDIVELQDDRIDVASDLDRPSEVLASDDHSKVQEVGEIQQQGNESGSELEEGELDADDQEGDDSIPPSMESPQIDEHAQTGENEESAISSATEPREIDSSQGLDDGKNEEVATEDVDSTDKANDVINEQVSSELDQGNLNTVSTTGKASTSGAGESSVSRQRSSVSAEPEGSQVSPVGRPEIEGGRQVSPVGRTINLSARARERASLRQAGMLPSTPGNPTSTPTTTVRGRGRARARGGRIARGGRGSTGE